MIASGAAAQWTFDGALVCDEIYTQYQPMILEDGEGGAFVAWSDRRATANDIFIQRIDAYGRSLWASGGVQVSVVGGYHYDPVLVSDGAGGCIVAFSMGEIFAQRFDGDGNRLWGNQGTLVCNAILSQTSVTMAADGSGGAVLAWADYRFGEYDIYAQKIDANGVSQWTANGVAVVVEVEAQVSPFIISDDDGGAIVAWQDRRNLQYEIYAQRILAAGTTTWLPNGTPIHSDPAQSLQYPTMLADGLGGAFIAWQGQDIFLTRINYGGQFVWPSDIVAVCDFANVQYFPSLMSDGSGGVILAWQDNRNGSDYDIYAHRMSGSGVDIWTPDGVAVCQATGHQTHPAITTDSLGGVYVTWLDERNGEAIFAQRVDASGTVNLAVDGVPLCTAPDAREPAVIISDGVGGMIAAWPDVRGYPDLYTDSAIYAQRMERNGYWGFPAPSIASVFDVPGDQGGQVYLTWDASRIDPWPAFEITSYGLWRSIDAVTALATTTIGSDLRVETTASGSIYWQRVQTIDAEFIEHYGAPVPTLFDSTSTSPGVHRFQVTAHTAVPQVFWASSPDSSRSLDNLAPEPPVNLTGALVPSLGLELTWSPNMEIDLDHYVIHRGDTPDFVPSAGTFVAMTADTTLTDTLWEPFSDWFYKVSAVDIHENTGPYATLIPEAVTAADDTMPSPNMVLHQNVPNPFNPSTTIAFDLPRAGSVTLQIYDMSGRVVRTLLSHESMESGRQEAVWRGRDDEGRQTAAGLYFYRLDAGDFSSTRSMMLVK